MGLHPHWVGLDLHLLDATAHVQDLGDAWDALQAGPDHPVGQRADLPGRHRGVGAAKADQEDFAHERRHRGKKRLDATGQSAAHALQPLLHKLACAVDVRAPAELGIDQRQADVGVRAQPGKAGDPHESTLDRLGDVDLHLLGGEAR